MINLKLNRGEVEDLQLGLLDLILIEKKPWGDRLLKKIGSKNRISKGRKVENDI